MKLERIAYVEDDVDIQAVARMALELVGGFVVEIFSSGREAVDGVADFSPDIILLDVMMPEMDGPETLEKLRQQPLLKEIPVIFMTAKVQPKEVAFYKSLGALDVIAKPFDPMTLSNQLEAIWSQQNG